MNTDELTELVCENFATFGGGKSNDWNPISIALKDHRPQFAAGVYVRNVVAFILERIGIGKN